MLIVFLFFSSFIVYLSITKNYKNKSLEFVNSVSLINKKENAADHEGKKSELIKDLRENNSLLDRELELLSISWKRDPFNLKSLIKNDKNLSSSLVTNDLQTNSSEKYEVDLSDRSVSLLQDKKRENMPQNSGSLEAAAKKSSEKRYKNKGSLDLELTGIVYFDNQYIALINDMSFKEGDTILDFKVNKIMRNRVILKDNSGEHYTMEFE